MKGIVIMAPLRTIPGKGAELEKLFLQMVPVVKKEKGTLEYVLYREFGKKSAPLLVGPVDLSKIRFFLPLE
ncbi:MAG: antibiotic biosynthesis monooxygenase [Dehalococcoidia bacterium]